MACPQLQVMQRRCQERAYDSSSRRALRQAHARSSDRTSGYETGADVYLTKPTNVHELEAVIQNLARRRLCVYLTLNEAHLLHDLTTAPERQLGTDDLIRRLSQEHTLQTQRDHLTVLISRLRSKIDDALPQKDIIKAVRGYGCKLTVPFVVE